MPGAQGGEKGGGRVTTAWQGDSGGRRRGGEAVRGPGRFPSKIFCALTA